MKAAPGRGVAAREGGHGRPSLHTVTYFRMDLLSLMGT